MAAWRRRALAAFPELRRELSEQGYSMYGLAGALLERARAAHDAGDATTLRRIYGFAQWCARQRGKELWNPIYVSFYEHLMDWPRQRAAVLAWLAPDVIENALPLWEWRLSGADLDEVRRLVTRPTPTARGELWPTLEGLTTQMPRRRTYATRFSVRVTSAELERLHARAKAAGLSLSRYLVEAALAPDRVPSPEDRARLERALFHLRKVGVNLNQVARKLNGGEEVPPPQLERALEATARAAEQLRESA